MSLEAIVWKEGKLKVLDQLLLPTLTVYLDVNDVKTAWSVINKMQVRGAPAIAIVGCLSVAAELGSKSFHSPSDLSQWVTEKLDYLVTARPTAVNMNNAAKELSHFTAEMVKNTGSKPKEIIKKIATWCSDFFLADIQTNKSLGDFGAEAILKHADQVGRVKVTLLTICNTGSLATAGYGTALGVVRSVSAQQRLEAVYMLETRPYLQGARLSAYEAVVEGWPNATLVCDSAVAALLSSRTVDGVVVGADRVAANGDTANKIGTYQLALLCHHFKVPFYVCSPLSTVDLNLESGQLIPIEERPGQEMTRLGGVTIAPSEINCWNPAFDVTPASLITGGIVTEKGVYQPSNLRDALSN